MFLSFALFLHLIFLLQDPSVDPEVSVIQLESSTESVLYLSHETDVANRQRGVVNLSVHEEEEYEYEYTD